MIFNKFVILKIMTGIFWMYFFYYSLLGVLEYFDMVFPFSENTLLLLIVLVAVLSLVVSLKVVLNFNKWGKLIWLIFSIPIALYLFINKHISSKAIMEDFEFKYFEHIDIYNYCYPFFIINILIFILVLIFYGRTSEKL